MPGAYSIGSEYRDEIAVCPIGLERGRVRIAPYTDEWLRLYREEEAHLRAAIGSYVLDIQHVGSTSIPGMPAKPIIDIAIAVADFDEAAVCIRPVVQLGYEYKGENGISRRHYLTKGDPRTHHIHINEITSDEWRDQMLFRDTLIGHPSLAEEYATLKLGLAQKYADDRERYTTEKTPFIQSVLRLARSDGGLT